MCFINHILCWMTHFLSFNNCPFAQENSKATTKPNAASPMVPFLHYSNNFGLSFSVFYSLSLKLCFGVKAKYHRAKKDDLSKQTSLYLREKQGQIKSSFQNPLKSFIRCTKLLAKLYGVRILNPFIYSFI